LQKRPTHCKWTTSFFGPGHKVATRSQPLFQFRAASIIARLISECVLLPRETGGQDHPRRSLVIWWLNGALLISPVFSSSDVLAKSTPVSNNFKKLTIFYDWVGSQEGNLIAD